MIKLHSDKRGNSLLRLAAGPERKQENTHLVSLHPARGVHPSISCGRVVVGNPGCMQGVKIRIGLGCHRDSLPWSGDLASSCICVISQRGVFSTTPRNGASRRSPQCWHHGHPGSFVNDVRPLAGCRPLIELGASGDIDRLPRDGRGLREQGSPLCGTAVGVACPPRRDECCLVIDQAVREQTGTFPPALLVLRGPKAQLAEVGIEEPARRHWWSFSPRFSAC